MADTVYLCPNCKTPRFNIEKRFCGHCGLPLPNIKQINCPKCGNPQPNLTNKFCGVCGTQFPIEGDISRPADPSYPYDVFISHSSKDKSVADNICSSLEKQSMRCWIAPRDIPPGMEYPEAIVNGIEKSYLMVLVFSAYSNESPQVCREIESAVNKKKHFIPFRIQDVPLSKNMQHLISLPQWLDAYTPPMDAHIMRLTTRVKELVDEKNSKN